MKYDGYSMKNGNTTAYVEDIEGANCYLKMGYEHISNDDPQAWSEKEIDLSNKHVQWMKDNPDKVIKYDSIEAFRKDISNST